MEEGKIYSSYYEGEFIDYGDYQEEAFRAVIESGNVENLKLLLEVASASEADYLWASLHYNPSHPESFNKAKEMIDILHYHRTPINIPNILADIDFLYQKKNRIYYYIEKLNT